ncbi:hypothetical protein GGC47_003179 [Bosea sp. OAE752]|uniref:hypothetical protein n=1 Tax=Bosea sp. OAE752 TaxID=2663873 RepID=UPI003D25A043
MAQSDLVVSVGANIAALERQMRAAAASSEKAAADIEARFNRMNPTFSTSALTGALKGFVAAFTLDKVIQGLAAANAELVRMGDTAKRVGLDVQRFQELQFAGRLNGLSGKQFGTGLEGLAEKLNESRQTENALSKLFDDNNLKLKDRKGQVIGINDALGKVAGLVQNAATEFDKIKIAEAVGLSREWVPLLEQGAVAIEKQASAAQAAGGVIDTEIIQKAKEFERSWAEATTRWATAFQANAGWIIGLIDTIIDKASGLFAGLERYSRGLSAKADLDQNGSAGASRETIAHLRSLAKESGKVLPDDLAARGRELDEIDAETRRRSGRRGNPERQPLEVTVQGRTNTKSLFNKGGGGGGGGKSEEEQAEDRLDRYIETLMRQNSVLDAQIATFGRSNAEKRAAVELAKAQVDLGKLDEDSRAKVIASLTKEIELSEQKRTQLESLKQTQKGLVDAQKFFGEAVTDGLTDMIVNGAKAQDVLKNLTATLIKATLQAALLGNGPLAGIFGTAGTNGNLGGIFGLFGGLKLASGGFVSGPGSNRSDSVPARLSNGEFVVNAGATRKHRDLLEAINNGRVPMMAAGGLVGSLPAIAPRAGSGGGVIVNVQNNTPAQVETKPRSDGGVDMIIRQVEGAMAQRFVRGQGSLSQAFGAVQNGRQYWG